MAKKSKKWTELIIKEVRANHFFTAPLIKLNLQSDVAWIEKAMSDSSDIIYRYWGKASKDCDDGVSSRLCGKEKFNLAISIFRFVISSFLCKFSISCGTKRHSRENVNPENL